MHTEKKKPRYWRTGADRKRTLARPLYTGTSQYTIRGAKLLEGLLCGIFAAAALYCLTGADAMTICHGICGPPSRFFHS